MKRHCYGFFLWFLQLVFKMVTKKLFRIDQSVVSHKIEFIGRMGFYKKLYEFLCDLAIHLLIWWLVFFGFVFIKNL